MKERQCINSGNFSQDNWCQGKEYGVRMEAEAQSDNGTRMNKPKENGGNGSLTEL
jgi:hypothetical protein